MATKTQGAAPTAIGLNRYIHAGFLVAFVILTYVLGKIVGFIWNWALPTNEYAVIGISLVLAGGVMFYVWRHPRVSVLSKEIATELSKVTWPTRKETSAFTITVIVTTVIAALILGLFDMFWSAVTGLVY